MVHIYDIMDHIKDDTTLESALRTISNYNIDRSLHATESRRWAQLFLSPGSYPPYQVQQFVVTKNCPLQH